jgi:hypothetical protein
MITSKIRNIFLTFAQALFQQDPFLTWDIDQEKTKIIIGPKNFYNNSLVKSLPSIIVDRSEIAWGYHTINQEIASGSLITQNSRSDYSDMLYGSVVYNVQAPNEGAAERIADYLYLQVSARKDDFKRVGINRLYGARLGRSQIIKSGEKSELITIPVSVTFAMQHEFSTVCNDNNLKITANISGNHSEETATTFSNLSEYGTSELLENIHYSVSGDGTQICFNDPTPSGVELTLNYYGNFTETLYTQTFDYTNGGSSCIDLSEMVAPWNYTLSGIEIYVQISDD